MTPVFIFSTPRAGSTLLQRILACHQKIATTAEPWVLLPLLSMTDNNTQDKTENTTINTSKNLANYSFETSTKAINNFANNINEKANKNKTADYNALVANFALSLYKASTEKNEAFFIDKTPRYYYIIDEIIKVFPNAKFIFLFRHPLQTYSSVLNTWNNNKFYKLYRNRDDLYLAPKLLSRAYEQHKDISLAINYDNLVNETHNTLDKICEYLHIEKLTPEAVDLNVNTFTHDEMGDQTGQKKYNKVSSNSLNNWYNTFNNPIRKWYIKRYITNLGDQVESVYGYSANELQHDIDLLPSTINSSLFHDIAGIIYHKLVYKYKLNVFFSSKQRNKESGFYD